MKIAVIGAGAMGGSLVEGLLKADLTGNAKITVADPSEERLAHFVHLGTSVTVDNRVAAAESDLVIVVVKPWLVEQVLKGISDVLDYTHQKLIVIAAGVKSSQIKAWIDKNGHMPPLFLVIPNIAIAERQSMTFIAPVDASAEDVQLVTQLFDALGHSIVTEERLLAAGTTLASCGLAYAMRYIRASVEGGVELGFRASDAERIVLQTVQGAVSLLQATGEHPEAAIDKVTTPGGVTIRGLNEMEHAGFTSAVIRGLKAGL